MSLDLDSPPQVADALLMRYTKNSEISGVIPARSRRRRMRLRPATGPQRDDDREGGGVPSSRVGPSA